MSEYFIRINGQAVETTRSIDDQLWLESCRIRRLKKHVTIWCAIFSTVAFLFSLAVLIAVLCLK